MLRGEQRLNPVAGADVERPSDRPPHGQVGERVRRALHAGNVLRAGPGLAQVGRDDEVVVRNEPHGCDDPVVAAGDEAESLEARGTERGEDAVGDVDGFAREQDEDPDQAREGALVPRESAQVRREVGRAREDVALGAEPRLDRRAGVARAGERSAKRGDVVRPVR